MQEWAGKNCATRENGNQSVMTLVDLASPVARKIVCYHMENINAFYTLVEHGKIRKGMATYFSNQRSSYKRAFLHTANLFGSMAIIKACRNSKMVSCKHSKGFVMHGAVMSMNHLLLKWVYCRSQGFRYSLNDAQRIIIQ